MRGSLEARITTSIHPMDVMRQTFRAMGIPFQENDGLVYARLGLENVEVQVVAWGSPDDLVKVIVRLPVRAAKKYRAPAGDFLHRLNCSARRKFWDFDPAIGEIRLSCFTDTLVGPLNQDLFRALLNSLLSAADAAFPYLTGVLAGRMSPEFAADQAEASIRTSWHGKEK